MTQDKTVAGDPDALDLDATSAEDEKRIGRYRLIEKIGEGGMGQVWRAEQERPVRRIVALKLIKLGMDTRQIVARFESERQALALMDHPNIARVFDAGASERGRPYFVMEHVPGVPIDEFCESAGLGVVERLELFVRVCHGVQHAHQKGIIHRDIKPSNVLVQQQDDGALPKIIDFGVAKATEQPLTDGAMRTQIGVMIGTPEYMSPEQAELTGDIDIRTDVYSLGALLYQLLVGRLPFDVSQASRTGIDEVRRTIREEEPQRPSTRVTSLTDGSSAPAVAHPAGRAQLARHLRGDLDWITMKALEKDRARRYASVSELAADIERHLAHQPVLAGPPSNLYRLSKFVRRHRTSVAAGVLVLLAMVAGTTAAGIGMVRALRAEELARQEAARAAQEAETAGQISNFLLGLFKLSDPNENRGNTVTAREILDRGADEIRTGLRQRPLVRARLMDTIGRVYQSLGLYAQALPLIEEARAARVELLGEAHSEVAASLTSLGHLLYLTGEYEESRSLSQRALEIQVGSVGPDHPDVARTLNNLALVAWRTGDHEDARTLHERALAVWEKTLGPDHPELAPPLHGLANLLTAMGDNEGARALYERVLQIQRSSLGADHPNVARTLTSIANLDKATGDLPLAQSLYEQALQINERVLGSDHPDLSYSLNGLADLLKETGDLEGARILLERSVEIRERAAGPDDGVVGSTLWQLAGVHRQRGELSVADGLYRRSLSIKAGILGPQSPTLVYDRACYRALIGDPGEALRLLERAVELGYSGEWIGRDPELKSLHGNPRFDALVASGASASR